jgi:hypothetical protein
MARYPFLSETIGSRRLQENIADNGSHPGRGCCDSLAGFRAAALWPSPNPAVRILAGSQPVLTFEKARIIPAAMQAMAPRQEGIISSSGMFQGVFGVEVHSVDTGEGKVSGMRCSKDDWHRRVSFVRKLKAREVNIHQARGEIAIALENHAISNPP